MIELGKTGILEKRDDGNYIATTTFTVERPVPGTFCIEVAGKTIPEVVENLMSYIREHSDEDESILLGIRGTVLGWMYESAELARIRDNPTQGVAWID